MPSSITRGQTKTVSQLNEGVSWRNLRRCTSNTIHQKVHQQAKTRGTAVRCWEHRAAHDHLAREENVLGSKGGAGAFEDDQPEI